MSNLQGLLCNVFLFLNKTMIFVEFFSFKIINLKGVNLVQHQQVNSASGGRERGGGGVQSKSTHPCNSDGPGQI